MDLDLIDNYKSELANNQYITIIGDTIRLCEKGKILEESNVSNFYIDDGHFYNLTTIDSVIPNFINSNQSIFSDLYSKIWSNYKRLYVENDVYANGWEYSTNELDIFIQEGIIYAYWDNSKFKAPISKFVLILDDDHKELYLDETLYEGDEAFDLYLFLSSEMENDLIDHCIRNKKVENRNKVIEGILK